jgi:two-component system response regulator YcbB
MKFYIVDDDKNIIRILSNIIEKNNNFEVVGSALNGEAAFQEIMVMKPDIVLVDLLMPVMDGNTLVKKLKEVNPHLSCIMISQVLDNQIRTESYNSGIEFFITKPINKIEVEKVITRVAETIEMNNTLSTIKQMFQLNDKKGKDLTEQNIIRIKNILGTLGMLGEKGTNDIIKITLYLMEENISFNDYDFSSSENIFGDNSHIVKQRIRRAINKGLVNIANLGLDDYGNEILYN